MSVSKSSNYVTGRVATRLRNGRNGVATGGGVVVGVGGVEHKDLMFVPYSVDDQTTWLVPDKPLRAAEGFRSDKDIIAIGDIIAKASKVVQFTATDGQSGGSQYLYQLLDVDISTPADGQSLIYSGGSQKWISRKLTAADVGARASDWVPVWDDVSGKPDTYPPTSHTHTKAEVGLSNVRNVEQLGKTETAADSNKLAGRNDYYNTSNCNSLLTPWRASTMSANYYNCNGFQAIGGSVTNLDFGSADQVLTLYSKGTPRTWVGGVIYELYHSGNLNRSDTDFACKNLNASSGYFIGDVVAKSTGAVVFTDNN